MNAAVRILTEKIRAVEHERTRVSDEVKRAEDALEARRQQLVDVCLVLTELREARDVLKAQG